MACHGLMTHASWPGTTRPRRRSPAGHSSTAAVLWGSLAVLRQIPAVIAGVIIGGVMLSRMFLGVHFLGDVLGGALLGLALAVSYRRLWPAIVRFVAGRSFEFFLALGAAVAVFAVLFTGLTSLSRELLGIVLGAGIGLPIRHRYVTFTPAGDSLRQQVLKVVIGLAGIVVILLIGAQVDQTAPITGVVTFALATLWVGLIAPVVFIHAGLTQTALKRIDAIDAERRGT